MPVEHYWVIDVMASSPFETLRSRRVRSAALAFAAAAAAAPAPITADVVVYGSTSGGVAAALAAARGNASVALVDCAARLGGMTTGGLGNTDKGDTYAIGGISREV